MSQGRAAAIAVTIALAASLISGCTAQSPEPADSEATGSASANPEPTATTALEVIGGGARPPALAGGDCATLVPPTILSETLGREVLGVRADDTPSSDALRNIGGVRCVWETGLDGGHVDVVALAALEQLGVTPVAGAYDSEGDCQWHCTWTWQDDRVWIGAVSWDGASDADTRARWSRTLGPQIAQASAAENAEWIRDTSAWWPSLDCGAVVSAVGEKGDRTAVGGLGGYDDLPPAADLLADDATSPTRCWIEFPGLISAQLRAEPGLAWSVPATPDYTPIDLGIPGIDSWVMAGWDGAPASFVLIDGVNRMQVAVTQGDSSGVAAQELAVAVARLMSSDPGLVAAAGGG